MVTEADAQRIEEYLASLKVEWRSSPSGLQWHRLLELLEAHSSSADDRPPPPFILAASGESNASKLYRLGEQLRWAAEHSCLDVALTYLDTVPLEHWNIGAPGRWDRSSYY
jgi:hypothetical protein